MKKIFLMLALVLPFATMAQIPQLDKLSAKYSNTEGVTAITIDKDMLSMFAGDNENFKYVDNVNIIVTENSELATNIIRDAEKVIKKLDAELLLDVNNEGQKINIYNRKKGDNITALFVTIDGGDQSGFIAIIGNIPQEALNEVVKVANM